MHLEGLLRKDVNLIRNTVTNLKIDKVSEEIPSFNNDETERFYQK